MSGISQNGMGMILELHFRIAEESNFRRIFCAMKYTHPRSAQNGCTPLGNACLKGHAEVVRALLSAGANKDAADKVGIILLLCSSFNIVCKQKYAQYVPDLLRSVVRHSVMPFLEVV